MKRPTLRALRNTAYVAYSYATRPRRTRRLVRAYWSVHHSAQPAELLNAVAETAALHLPGVRVDTVAFQVFQSERGITYDTANVAFVPVGATEAADVIRLTLGGSPDWFGGLKPGQADRPALEASRDRVKAALELLKPTPDVHVVRVPVEG